MTPNTPFNIDGKVHMITEEDDRNARAEALKAYLRHIHAVAKPVETQPQKINESI